MVAMKQRIAREESVGPVSESTAGTSAARELQIPVLASHSANFLRIPLTRFTSACCLVQRGRRTRKPIRLFRAAPNLFVTVRSPVCSPLPLDERRPSALDTCIMADETEYYYSDDDYEYPGDGPASPSGKSTGVASPGAASRFVKRPLPLLPPRAVLPTPPPSAHTVRYGAPPLRALSSCP
jgi:hypothetical protein